VIKTSGIITFTTDFGTRDPYAAMMKGVVLGVNPRAVIVDITHDIPPHDIVNGAFTLLRAYRSFPEGTVHVAVVDPGVGGRRKNIAAGVDGHLFVGPDNGLFAEIIACGEGPEIHLIKNPLFMRDVVSDTFHGRDVFAPCAAHLSIGAELSGIGPLVKHLSRLDYPKITHSGNVLEGEVLTVDTFGNLITNIPRRDFVAFTGSKNVEIIFCAERFDSVRTHYGEVDNGQPLVLFGSSGFLEISMNEGNAAEYFMAGSHAPVLVRKF